MQDYLLHQLRGKCHGNRLQSLLAQYITGYNTHRKVHVEVATESIFEPAGPRDEGSQTSSRLVRQKYSRKPEERLVLQERLGYVFSDAKLLDGVFSQYPKKDGQLCQQALAHVGESVLTMCHTYLHALSHPQRHFKHGDFNAARQLAGVQEGIPHFLHLSMQDFVRMPAYVTRVSPGHQGVAFQALIGALYMDGGPWPVMQLLMQRYPGYKLSHGEAPECSALVTDITKGLIREHLHGYEFADPRLLQWACVVPEMDVALPYATALQALGRALLELLAREHLLFLTTHDPAWMRAQEVHVVRRLQQGLLDFKRLAKAPRKLSLPIYAALSPTNIVFAPDIDKRLRQQTQHGFLGALLLDTAQLTAPPTPASKGTSAPSPPPASPPDFGSVFGTPDDTRSGLIIGQSAWQIKLVKLHATLAMLGIVEGDYKFAERTTPWLRSDMGVSHAEYANTVAVQGWQAALYTGVQAAIHEAKRKAKVGPEHTRPQPPMMTAPPHKRNPDDAGTIWRHVAASWRGGSVPQGAQWRSVLRWQDNRRHRPALYNPTFVVKKLAREFRNPPAELVAVPMHSTLKTSLYVQHGVQAACREVLTRQLLRDYAIRTFGRELLSGAAASAASVWQQLNSKVVAQMGELEGSAARVYAHVRLTQRQQDVQQVARIQVGQAISWGQVSLLGAPSTQGVVSALNNRGDGVEARDGVYAVSNHEGGGMLTARDRQSGAQEDASCSRIAMVSTRYEEAPDDKTSNDAKQRLGDMRCPADMVSNVSQGVDNQSCELHPQVQNQIGSPALAIPQHTLTPAALCLPKVKVASTPPSQSLAQINPPETTPSAFAYLQPEVRLDDLEPLDTWLLRHRDALFSRSKAFRAQRVRMEQAVYGTKHLRATAYGVHDKLMRGLLEGLKIDMDAEFASAARSIDKARSQALLPPLYAALPRIPGIPHFLVDSWGAQAAFQHPQKGGVSCKHLASAELQGQNTSQPEQRASDQRLEGEKNGSLGGLTSSVDLLQEGGSFTPLRPSVFHLLEDRHKDNLEVIKIYKEKKSRKEARANQMWWRKRRQQIDAWKCKRTGLAM